MARWRIKQQSYIDDRLYQVDEEYVDPTNNKVPGPHWEPIDDHAKNVSTKAKVEFTGEVPDVIAQIMPMYERATAEAAAAGKTLGVPELIEALKGAFGGIINPEKQQAEFDAAVEKRVRAVLAEIKKANDAAKGGKDKTGEAAPQNQS